MTIKVYHVVRQYHPSVGGLEDVVYNIARHQLADGTQQPTIITLNRLFNGDTSELPAEEWLDGIRVIRLSYRGSSRYPICPAVLRAIRDADIVHVHGVDFFYDFLAWTRWLHGKPIVAASHGIYFHTPFASCLKRVFFQTVTRASSWFYERIYATSENDGRLFGHICDGQKVEVIENGVDVEKFRLTRSEAPAPRIIYFGRWSQNKGLEQTIALFARLHQVAPQWRLVIAGREYDHDRHSLAALIARAGLDQVVELCPNPDNATLRDQIARAGYFICRSRHEGFGLAAIEAMSAGLYPLLSPIPPFAKIVNASGMGLLLEEDDAANVGQLLALHETLDERVGEQLAAAVQHFSWQFVSNRYIDEYRNVALHHGMGV